MVGRPRDTGGLQAEARISQVGWGVYGVCSRTGRRSELGVWAPSSLTFRSFEEV